MLYLGLARDERVAARAGFAWGCAEGLFFFIVPDVFVTFAGLYSLRAGAVAWGASIAGSLAAVCVIYLLTAMAGPAYVTFIGHIPGISGGMIHGVGQWLRAGLPYTPWLIMGGVPLKVYAGIALAQGTGIGAVLLWTVFARIVRIAPIYLLVVVARLVFRRSIDVRPGAWCVALATVWTVFYIYYFVAMSRRIWS
ncbi:MAG: hypothetical protein ABR537_06890 [Gemmatimonadales bacterium]